MQIMRLFSAVACAIFVESCSASTGVPASIQNDGLSPHVRDRANVPPPFQAFNKGRVVRATGYELLYSFKGAPDGAGPAGLVVLSHELYGTTVSGGDGAQGGTVFKMNSSGTEQVLYSFKGGADGAEPLAALTPFNGMLYGTTFAGGRSHGTIFKITTTGKEAVLDKFYGPPDGSGPDSQLLVANGQLFGTTLWGGEFYNGSAFARRPSGGINEKVFFSFNAQNPADQSAYPSGLTTGNRVFYGTTAVGGRGNCGNANGVRQGCGSIFTLDRFGNQRVMYEFKGGQDGGGPSGGVISINGVLYGTTAGGGGSGCQGGGCGTVYEVASGKESILYRFKGRGDGAYPSGIVAFNRNFYGSTAGGDVLKDYGTIFEMTKAGQVRVLHSFKGSPYHGPDGSHPSTALIVFDGALYGGTSLGGANGDGAIFRFVPSGASPK
jgi:uncharacterized repeat protein (TIGR03803 family)